MINPQCAGNSTHSIGRERRGGERDRDNNSTSDVPFCDPVPEDFQCGICFTAARDAVVTEECGHLFCRAVSTQVVFCMSYMCLKFYSHQVLGIS